MSSETSIISPYKRSRSQTILRSLSKSISRSLERISMPMVFDAELERKNFAKFVDSKIIPRARLEIYAEENVGFFSGAERGRVEHAARNLRAFLEQTGRGPKGLSPGKARNQARKHLQGLSSQIEALKSKRKFLDAQKFYLEDLKEFVREKEDRLRSAKSEKILEAESLGRSLTKARSIEYLAQKISEQLLKKARENGKSEASDPREKLEAFARQLRGLIETKAKILKLKDQAKFLEFSRENVVILSNINREIEESL